MLMSIRGQSARPPGQAPPAGMILLAGRKPSVRKSLLTMNANGIANTRFSVLVGPLKIWGRTRGPTPGSWAHRLEADTSEAITFAVSPPGMVLRPTGALPTEQTLKLFRALSRAATPSQDPERVPMYRVTHTS